MVPFDVNEQQLTAATQSLADAVGKLEIPRQYLSLSLHILLAAVFHSTMGAWASEKLAGCVTGIYQEDSRRQEN
jgi:hypothetical protein